MKRHANEFGLAAMCRALHVRRGGYYAWLREPNSVGARDDQRLLGLIKHCWLESGSICGHRKITKDLRELGETCSKHRVARLMKQEGLRAIVGYGRRPRPLNGPIGAVANNVLARAFIAAEPNRTWVTDITYIRTYEGFLYLAVVLDFFSRQVVGWATRPTQHTDLVLQALLAAVWRRKPEPGLLLHSDQGQSIHERRLAEPFENARHHAQHESTRKLSRQCGNGKPLPIAQAPAHQAANLHHPCRCPR